MSLSIRTSVGSLQSHRSLQNSNKLQQRSIRKLSSGLDVQRAHDGAARLGLSENLRAQLGGFKTALRNAKEGESILQTVEGTYMSVSDVLVQMRELAVQAASDGIGDGERDLLDDEYQALMTEIDRITDVAEWNGKNLISGGPGADTLLTFQVGTRNSGNDVIEYNIRDQSALFLAIDTTSVTSITNAQDAINALDDAMVDLHTDQADIGAKLNRLRISMGNLSSAIEDSSTSIGVIRDTDYGAESTEFTRRQVLKEASVAMLSQANAMPQIALRLLG